MTEKKSGAFVNLVKKAVGLPTGGSTCCGAPATASESACCGGSTAPAKETASAGSCCSADQTSTKPAGGSCCG